MRSETEVRLAAGLLHWLTSRADGTSPDALTADAALMALDWVLGTGPGNPLDEILADLMALARPPRKCGRPPGWPPSRRHRT